MGRKVSPYKSPIFGKKIVITGTLHLMKRNDAEERIKEHGGTFSNSVTTQTDYLIIGEHPGSTKLNDAARYGTITITEEEFLNMLIGKQAEDVVSETKKLAVKVKKLEKPISSRNLDLG